MTEFFDTPAEEPKKTKWEPKTPYENGKTYVSFSQFSKWQTCPASWKFDKIDKLGKFEGSISTVFGTAIHETIQTYLDILYCYGAPKADSMDKLGKFQEVFMREFEKNVKDGVVFDDMDAIKEHIMHGKEIIEDILSYKNRAKYFPTQTLELIAIERELKFELKPNILFTAFLDLVFKDKTTGKIKIIDIKTSSMGWNKYQKADPAKLDQLVLYKKYYAEKMNIKESQIEVVFLILKRKLMENVAFPQSRVQLVVPPSGVNTTKDLTTRFNEFVDTCFKSGGGYNTEANYPKNPGQRKKNCKYCPFKEILRKDGTPVCDQME
jgi:hypothetical protein